MPLPSGSPAETPAAGSATQRRDSVALSPSMGLMPHSYMTQGRHGSPSRAGQVSRFGGSTQIRWVRFREEKYLRSFSAAPFHQQMFSAWQFVLPTLHGALLSGWLEYHRTASTRSVGCVQHFPLPDARVPQCSTVDCIQAPPVHSSRAALESVGTTTTSRCSCESITFQRALGRASCR